MKYCSKCDETKQLSEFSPNKARHDKVSTYCTICTKQYRKESYARDKDKYVERARVYAKANKDKLREYRQDYYQKNIEKSKGYSQTVAGRHTVYKAGAKKRGFSWELTLADFKGFWQKPCTYCSEQIDTIGLDRVDSSLGYTVENITPCCTTCNLMKRDLTVEEFMSKITQIHKHYIKRKE